VAYVAASADRANCVLRTTEKRIAELEGLQNQSAKRRVAAEIVPPSEPPASVSGVASDAGADHVIRSMLARRGGRYYFEVTLDHGLIRDKLEADLVARLSDGQGWVGTSHSIRPQNIVLKFPEGGSVVIQGGNVGDFRLPKIVVGVAADLDAGSLYWHRDGRWKDGAVPGSPQGMALRRSAEFRAELSSSVPLKPLVDLGIVAVNFGTAPFLRPPREHARSGQARRVAHMRTVAGHAPPGRDRSHRSAPEGEWRGAGQAGAVPARDRLFHPSRRNVRADRAGRRQRLLGVHQASAEGTARARIRCRVHDA